MPEVTIPPKLGYDKKAWADWADFSSESKKGVVSCVAFACCQVRPKEISADERILFHIEMIDIDKN